jgi:probable rRNA maturation factor
VQIDARYRAHINAARLRAAARAALEAQGVRRATTLTIVVSGDARLRKLNREFAGIDAPTDVLSFTAEDKHSVYLGDVVISLMRAREQAQHDGHALIDEMRLLVIHGVLHLLGHDHHDADERKRMWNVQARALKQAGASIRGPVL